MLSFGKKMLVYDFVAFFLLFERLGNRIVWVAELANKYTRQVLLAREESESSV
jgi:hypothetical protein